MSKEKLDIIVNEGEKAFQSEEKRREFLDKKAERFAAATSLVFGLHIIDIEKLNFIGNFQNMLYSGSAIGAVFFLSISLVLALLSNRVLNYYSYPRGTKLIDELKEDEITEEDAKIKVALMYLKAHDINAKVNDSRAKWLSFSGIFLVVGFFIAIASHIVAKSFIP